MSYFKKALVSSGKQMKARILLVALAILSVVAVAPAQSKTMPKKPMMGKKMPTMGKKPMMMKDPKTGKMVPAMKDPKTGKMVPMPKKPMMKKTMGKKH